MRLSWLIATVLGIGYIRPAPGTWASLVALPWAWLLHVVAGPWLLLAGIFFGFFKGWWAVSREIEGREDHDPSEIVVDEFIGQSIAFLPVSIGAAVYGVAILSLWPGWIAAFALFRLFDIWKPGLVGWADRRKDSLGVMLDDAVAGVFAGAGVAVFAIAYHSLLPL